MRTLTGAVRRGGLAYLGALGVGSLVLGLALLLSVVVGPSEVGADAAWAALSGGWTDRAVEPMIADVVLGLRLPRALLAAIVGGALAVSGVVLQAVMRNPLADPYVLGVSSGATVGAALVAATGLGATALGGAATAAGAFLAGAIGMAVVFSVARASGRLDALRLLLAGVAWSAFATALTGLLLFAAPDAERVRGLLFWILGGLSGADWASVSGCGLVLAVSSAALWLLGPWQDQLGLGDAAAADLGLDVGRARTVLVVLASLLTGAAVAVAGAIGFVGLVVPHALRPLVGPVHRRLVPASLIGGATLLVLVDAVARTAVAPRELPAGVLTGALGAPFFLVLLGRLGRREAAG